MNASYAYIYDDFLADRAVEREVAALETTLNTFNVAGRIGRLALFRSAKDLVAGMVKQGATTVVAVGNDSTLDKVMWFMPDLDVTCGYIPLVGPSQVGELLGIPTGVKACEVLAARYVETLDVGRLDDRYFLTEVAVRSTVAALEIEGKYRISPSSGGSLSIRNLGGRSGATLERADAKDGQLEVVVTPRHEEPRSRLWGRPKPVTETRMLFQHGTIISSDPMEALADNHAVSGFRFEVGVESGKLRIITGRGHRRQVLQHDVKGGTFRTASKRT